MEGTNVRMIIGYFLLVSGFIVLVMPGMFGFAISITDLLIGFGLIVLGVIVVITPPHRGLLEYWVREMGEWMSMSESERKFWVREMREWGCIILISFGVSASVFGIFSILIFKNFTIISIGLGLLLLGLTLLPQPSRERLTRFIRHPLRDSGGYRLERERETEREIQEERPVPRKKPKGFSKVKRKEYGRIPEDAIDPFTHNKIHNLIAKGKGIIRCRDCGACYDEDVWKFYGKKCVRIGCSNAEV